MLIQKKLLEQLISLASDSAEYLNSGEHWITVHPHGKDSKGQPLLVKDGETSKQAVERKFGNGDNNKKEETNPIADRQKRIEKLIQHADAVSMFDTGSIEKRQHDRLKNEITSLDLSEKEKEDINEKLLDFHEKILEQKTKAVNPYQVGVAEFNKRVGFAKTQGAMDKSLRIESERNSYIEEIKKGLKKKEQAEDDKGLWKSATKAINEGLLEFEYGGKKYIRKTTRGKSFTTRD